MSESIGGWIISVTCCAMVISILQTFFLKGGLKKVGVFAGGVLLLLTALRPLTRLNEGWFSDVTAQFEVENAEYTSELTRNSRSLLEKIIEKECQAYILENAEQLGFSCEVSVQCDLTDEGLPIPAQVTVSANAENVQLQALAALIEEELGIAAENQIYREAGQ